MFLGALDLGPPWWAEGLVRLGANPSDFSRGGLPGRNFAASMSTHRRHHEWWTRNYSPSANNFSLREGFREFDEAKNVGPACGVSGDRGADQQARRSRIPTRGRNRVGKRTGDGGCVVDMETAPRTVQVQFDDGAVEVKEGQDGDGMFHGGSGRPFTSSCRRLVAPAASSSEPPMNLGLVCGQSELGAASREAGHHTIASRPRAESFGANRSTPPRHNRANLGKCDGPRRFRQ